MTDRIEATLAPDIDPAWAEEFVLEARLRDVPGNRIGDALGEVNAHCRDAGESAAEAFGDPIAYARTVAAQSTPVTVPWLSTFGPTLVQVVGVVLTLSGVGTWVTGRPLVVTWGMAGAIVLLCAGVAGLGMLLGRALGAIVRRPILAPIVGGLSAAAIAAAVFAMLLIEAPIGELPFALVLCVGVAVLVVGIAWEIGVARSGALDDPITAPGAEVAPRPRRVPWVSLGALGWVAIGAIVIVLFGGR